MIFRVYGTTVAKEQEVWVKKCHELSLDGGAWLEHSENWDSLDDLIAYQIAELIARVESLAPRVLDLGCGEGRFIRKLKSQHPDWDMSGVDPLMENIPLGIVRGSASHIPFPEGSFNVIYSYVALQHVEDAEMALAECNRVLKPGGYLLIADRNPISARGALKPWHELRGRWIYPWDSPFRERWFTASQWTRKLRNCGFELCVARSINHPGDRGLHRLIPTNRFLVLMARKLARSMA